MDKVPKEVKHGSTATGHRDFKGGTRRKRGGWGEKTEEKEGGGEDRMKNIQKKEHHK